ncbi:sugar phosphate isomerase/epimerase [Acidisoma sp. L85]|uniref:sugar phosphate isomerase/epimerase family protein n=1 Tax=Acidisoma sp. L85 TaxID=1641850 RepID=UPI00131A728D|nr:sugar phosphate isomerase/epimerase family protein [Acidisoma sp. L85]
MIMGFHSVALHNRSVEQAIDLVAAAGFGAIELNAETLPWAEPHVTPELDAERRKGIRHRCAAAGLSISAISAHIPMVEVGRSTRQGAIAYVNGCTDLAADVGAPVSHILSGALPQGADPEEAWRWFREAVAETVRHAQAVGVALAIEAIAGHLFHRISDYERLAHDLPDVPFKVNFDPSHLVVQGETPADLVERLSSTIVHVHLKDGAGRYPDFMFPPLGDGVINFDALLSQLVEKGYKGTISVEYEANVFGYTDDEQEILKASREYLERLGRWVSK